MAWEALNPLPVIPGKVGQVYQGRAGSHSLLASVLSTFQVTQCGSRGGSVQPAQSVHQGCIQCWGRKREGPLPPLAADPSLPMQRQGRSTRASGLALHHAGERGRKQCTQLTSQLTYCPMFSADFVKRIKTCQILIHSRLTQ